MDRHIPVRPCGIDLQGHIDSCTLGIYVIRLALKAIGEDECRQR
jgi:hypothetical protein